MAIELKGGLIWWRGHTDIQRDFLLIAFSRRVRKRSLKKKFAEKTEEHSSRGSME